MIEVPLLGDPAGPIIPWRTSGWIGLDGITMGVIQRRGRHHTTGATDATVAPDATVRPPVVARPVPAL